MLRRTPLRGADFRRDAYFHGMMDFLNRMVAFQQRVSAWFDLFENLAVQANTYAYG